MNKPTLRHPGTSRTRFHLSSSIFCLLFFLTGISIDLNPNNIFISPETGAVSCLIDWQHSMIQPLLLVAGYPVAFENPEINDPDPLDLKEPPSPSEDKYYSSMDAEEKAETDELYRRQTLFHYYRIFNGMLNKPHLSAQRDPLLKPRQHLIDRAGREWNGDLITLMGALVRMVEYWPLLPDTNGVKCPVAFKPDELDTFFKNEEIQFSLNAVVNMWRDEIGVNEDGWVINEEFEGAVRKSGQLRDKLMREIKEEGDEEDITLLNKGWPFRDHEE